MAKVRSHPKPETPRHFIREWRKYRGLTLEPLRMDALWSISDQLAKASPDQQKQALAVIETLLRTGTDG